MDSAIPSGLRYGRLNSRLIALFKRVQMLVERRFSCSLQLVLNSRHRPVAVPTGTSAKRWYQDNLGNRLSSPSSSFIEPGPNLTASTLSKFRSQGGVAQLPVIVDGFVIGTLEIKTEKLLTEKQEQQLLEILDLSLLALIPAIHKIDFLDLCASHLQHSVTEINPRFADLNADDPLSRSLAVGQKFAKVVRLGDHRPSPALQNFRAGQRQAVAGAYLDHKLVLPVRAPTKPVLILAESEENALRVVHSLKGQFQRSHFLTWETLVQAGLILDAAANDQLFLEDIVIHVPNLHHLSPRDLDNVLSSMSQSLPQAIWLVSSAVDTAAIPHLSPKLRSLLSHEIIRAGSWVENFLGSRLENDLH